MKRSGIAILLSLVLLFSLTSMAGAAIDGQQGRDNPDPGRERKIVIFNAAVGEADQDKIINGAGGQKIKHLPLINATAVKLNPSAEKALKNQPGVLRIDPDIVVFAQVKPVAPAPPKQDVPWGVDRIDADKVWADNKGSGVKVAVIDTGIDLDHPDLAANIKGGVNTINPARSADDDNGHGTHVAGIIAGLNNTVGVVGVAPEASLYAVKVLSKSGSGLLSDVIEGLQWCVDNGIQVANMSLGTSTDVKSFHDAIAVASNHMVLVAAAGNSGPGDNTVEYPAKYEGVIAVSATSSNDVITTWSSRGPQVELAAPGAAIYSTYKGGKYATLSGTSMASPHVAGTVALIISSGVTDIGAIRAELQSTADNLGNSGWDYLYGYGLVDAEEAASGI